MMRFLKKFAWAGVMAGTLQGAFGFSMLGPFDSWQVTQLGYQTGFLGFNEPHPPGVIDFPLGGPMNLGEEYRWNIPVLYYSFDQDFLDYFGSNGVYAVEQAIAVFNGLTNVSSYSGDLSEFPLESSRKNFKAETLLMVELKSETMSALIEELGLA